jgi:hypothetical protein
MSVDEARRLPVRLMPLRRRSPDRRPDEDSAPEPTAASWFDPPVPEPTAFYEDGRLVLPARARPATETLTRAAEQSRILRQVGALCDFLGDGRPLTDKGNLKLADATALVAVAETGDELEPRLGDTTWRLRTATQLRHLDTLLRWARRTRAIRTVKGTLVPTATFQKLDPVAALDRLVDDLFDVGPVALARPEIYPAEFPVVQFVDASVVTMLTVAYEHLEPLDVAQTVDRLAHHFLETVPTPPWIRPEHLDDDIARYINDAIRGLEAAGIVVRNDAVTVPKPGGWTVTTGGTLSLTPWGIATVQRLAPGWNIDAPVLTHFSVETGDDPIGLYRALDEQLRRSGPAALLLSFDEVGPERRLLVEQGWRIDDPAVLPVLDALGRNHPDRGTAKAARKAALRHRSRIAAATR